MHTTTPDQVHWHEPGARYAGFRKFLRKPMPYDTLSWMLELSV